MDYTKNDFPKRNAHTHRPECKSPEGTAAEEHAVPAASTEDAREYADTDAACEDARTDGEQASHDGTAGQGDAVPAASALHYEFSDDCRSLLIQRCKQAAAGCGGVLRKREPFRQKPVRNGEEAQPFLLDVVNCRISDFSGSGSSTQMPVFCCMDDKEPRLCDPRGVYSQTLVDCYELFQDERKETRHLRHSILRRSLEEVIGAALPAAGCRFMCLMPDIVDDFDQVFRAQLNYRGTPLFQVPRSIALAYTLQAEGWQLPDEFLCLDYDGEDFSAIKLCSAVDENGDRIFIRMGREKLPGRHPSTRELSIEYLRRYQEKHGLRFSKSAISNLVNTKRLQHLLFEQPRFLLLDNDGIVTPLCADTAILNELARRIYQDMEQIQDSTDMTVYAMCALFKDPSESLYNISQMEVGCRAICERADQGKTLWQEYLPDLRLEVNRNGCFDQIQLISAENRRQNINTFALNEKVRIPVADGTVTFPANGEKYYDLPLIREVFGRHAKEKLARFILEKPLKKPVQVELSVHYQYGDIDSYQLAAYARELDQTIYSSWRDTEAISLPNPAPSFSEVSYARRITSEEDANELKEVYEAFLRAYTKIMKANRSLRHKYGSVYAIPKNSRSYYSKYLFELNKGGMPYFSIQNFFRRESLRETQPYISQLFHEGVFSAVGDVLHGRRPVSHDLGKDEQTGQDESAVLIRNMADIASCFGVFFALEDTDAESFDTVEDILSFYKQNKYPKIRHWAPMTKYVRSDNDPHEIWRCFRSSLRQMQPQRPWSTIYDLQAISGVCFQTETWIFDLYHGPHGKNDVEWIIKNVIAVLYDKDCLSERDHQGRYNPRKIRDVLELLLCICRLKAEDPWILDCNEQGTKQLVKQLKKIDADMRRMQEAGELKYSFNSRLGITAPAAYSRVNPVIYALVETLSGGEQVSLIGFSNEEGED